MYCVFDGHGGAQVAKFAERRIAEVVATSPHFAAGEYGQALTEAFKRCAILLCFADLVS